MSLSLQPFPQPATGGAIIASSQNWRSQPRLQQGHPEPRASLPRGRRKQAEWGRGDMGTRSETPSRGGSGPTLGTPGRRKLGDTAHSPTEDAGAESPGLQGPATARVHTPAWGNGRAALPPPGALTEGVREGPNEKLGKVECGPLDPSSAHLAPQRRAGPGPSPRAEAPEPPGSPRPGPSPAPAPPPAPGTVRPGPTAAERRQLRSKDRR